MYTLKVKFNINDYKSYDYASMNKITSITTEVKDPSGNYQTTYVVSCEKGLTERCTKWKSGGVVTSENRAKFGRLECVPELTVDEVMGAIAVLHRVQMLPNVYTFGLNNMGNIYYDLDSRGSTTITPTASIIGDILNDKKSKLQKKLEELVSKVEELKSQIGEL